MDIQHQARNSLDNDRKLQKIYDAAFLSGEDTQGAPFWWQNGSLHCTLIHGYIKTPNMNFVFLLQSMPYDVKIGPHQMKTVIDDENLHKLSFFETC